MSAGKCRAPHGACHADGSPSKCFRHTLPQGVCAAAEDGDCKIAYSADGVNWTAVSNNTFGTYDKIYGIAYGDNRFVAVGDRGKMAYSTDGVNWTAISDSTVWNYTNNGTTFPVGINAIAYGNGRFVAVGQIGKMAYSADGINWTAVSNSTVWIYTDTIAGTFPVSIRGIGYGNDRWVAGGGNGKMAYCDW